MKGFIEVTVKSNDSKKIYKYSVNIQQIWAITPMCENAMIFGTSACITVLNSYNEIKRKIKEAME